MFRNMVVEDEFTYKVWERTDPNHMVLRAGAMNVDTATAAFHKEVEKFPNKVFTLQYRGRIVRDSRG